MEPVNPNDFRIEKMDIIHLSGTGTAKLESKHEYVLGPGLASAKVIVGRGSETVSFYSLDGKLIKSFDRAYSDKPTVNYDLESMLRGLKRKPNSWPNSPVRDAIEDNVFRRYMDDADGKERHRMLYMLSSNAEEFGFGISCVAMGDLFDSGRIPSKDDLASLSRRMQSFPCANSVNPTGVDLKIFDILMGKEA
jgi:hypothetical protein